MVKLQQVKDSRPAVVVDITESPPSQCLRIGHRQCWVQKNKKNVEVQNWVLIEIDTGLSGSSFYQN